MDHVFLVLARLACWNGRRQQRIRHRFVDAVRIYFRHSIRRDIHAGRNWLAPRVLVNRVPDLGCLQDDQLREQRGHLTHVERAQLVRPRDAVERNRHYDEAAGQVPALTPQRRIILV